MKKNEGMIIEHKGKWDKLNDDALQYRLLVRARQNTLRTRLVWWAVKRHNYLPYKIRLYMKKNEDMIIEHKENWDKLNDDDSNITYRLS
jgi:hypothetical protein